MRIRSLPRAGIGNLKGHAYDISQTGVRIELDQPLDVGESVSVTLNLPGGEKDIFADAEVVWANDHEDDPGPARMGLRFTDFKSPADQNRLARCLTMSVDV